MAVVKEQETETTARIAGKTYSLFGSGPSTSDYYRKISALADRVLERDPNIKSVIKALARAGGRKRLLEKRLRHDRARKSLVSFVLAEARESLAPHTALVKDHIRSLSFLKRWDAVLSTSEVQYHVYMLLIELANRAWGEAFRAAKRRLAFLPHCLRDLKATCRSGPGELDTVCKGCSKDCFVNRASTILRNAQVEPYIWMNANLKSLLKDLRDRQDSIGVLGVACLPELVHGMRLCMGLDIPVVGIPLNANRCMRWMGAFHPTSVNLEALGKLLTERNGK